MPHRKPLDEKFPIQRQLEPSNTAFAGKAIALDQVPAKLDAWLLLHNIRIAIALAASVLGVVAVNR